MFNFINMNFVFLKVIFILVIIIMRKRIGLVVQLFAQAQKALGDMPFLLFLPIFTCIFAFAFWIYWFFGALLMASFGRLVNFGVAL